MALKTDDVLALNDEWTWSVKQSSWIFFRKIA